jgi:hypothetical protein
MLRLIIKGDAFAAREALDARGLLTVMCLDPRPETGVTIAEVDSRDLPTVARYFAEPVAVAKGEGFPPGSLLHYQEIEGYDAQ